jgi:hypothetical protein
VVISDTLYSTSSTRDFTVIIQEPCTVQYSVTAMYAHYNAGSGVRVGTGAHADRAF